MPGSPSGGIFLCYRRDDTGAYARLLQSALGQRFPDARVFVDQVRAPEAEHTLLLTFMMDGTPMRQYLGQRQHRITPDAWADIDEHFDFGQSLTANCRLRLEDCSVSAAPSRLEIRNLVVTEHEPPLTLMPVTT